MSTLYPTFNIIYDRKKVASKTKKASLELRITYNYQQKYISTGIKLYPHQWKNGLIVNCPDTIQLCETLNSIVAEVRQIVLDMMQNGCINLDGISEELAKKKQKKIGFIEYCRQRADVRKYGKQKDTQERYDRFLRLFTAWGKIVKFEDITDESIITYDKYLIGTGLQISSKWNNYHRFLSGFISDAIEDGLMKRNPYKWLNIPTGKTSHSIDKCLTAQELEILRLAKMPTKSLERIRDLFVFQTYTCLRYSDLALFDVKYIQEIKGTKVYIRDSKKTRKQFTVPLLKPVLDILDKYDGKLPIVSNVKYNYYLKVVSQAAGFDYPLTTHWARHTGATILLNEGVDLKIVSKICGHSSLRITEQVYAKLLNSTVVDAIKNKKSSLK